jgi:hypothetical protein
MRRAGASCPAGPFVILGRDVVARWGAEDRWFYHRPPPSKLGAEAGNHVMPRLERSNRSRTPLAASYLSRRDKMHRFGFRVSRLSGLHREVSVSGTSHAVRAIHPSWASLILASVSLIVRPPRSIE